MPALTVADCASLAASWQRTLRAERKSEQTQKSYGDGLRFYLAYCDQHDLAPLVRANLTAWTAHMLDTGSAPSTARSRQLAERRFAAWLVVEGEAETDPFIGIQSPKLDEKVIEPLSEDDVRAMLASCAPPKGASPKQTMFHRRDEVIIRFMFETGTRAGEVVALALDDVDLDAGTAIVRRGKGGKGGTVPFGSQVALALDRYLRLRRIHRLADSEML